MVAAFAAASGSVAWADWPSDPYVTDGGRARATLDQPGWLTGGEPMATRGACFGRGGWMADGAGYADDADGADAANPDNEDNEETDQLTPCVEELFLGTVVYPQEQNELQLTWGAYHAVETERDWQALFELEYGITDRLQIGLECPTELYSPDESYRGMRTVGVELYYNFYSDRRTGRAYGIGFGWGAPVDAPRDEARAHEYEPYAVVFQEFDGWAVNLFGGLEIEDSLEPGEATETTGELAAALIGPCAGWTPLLEVGVEVAPQQTSVRLAPGLYVHRVFGPVDVAASLPVGLEGDAPKLGIWLMAIVELDPAEGTRRTVSHAGTESRRRK